MKDNLGSDYFLIGHVDIDRAYFRREKELGLDFINEIDAWSKMEFKFRRASRRHYKYSRNDLSSFVYGLRTAID